MRIYLAATNSGMTQEDRETFINKGKPKYQLCTFIEGEKNCHRNLVEAGRDNFLLDSGAFSFMSGKECSKETLIEYCDSYIDFINRNDVKQFFEIDVDTIFGIDFVEQLRKRIESRTGKSCIPVWHKGRGIDYWKRMVDEYNYIAIGGLVFHVKQSEWGMIKKLVDYAYFKHVKVHGLGFTKTNILDQFRWYSVDSTSWKMSALRGQNIQTFNDGQMLQRKLNTNGKKSNLSKLALHNGLEWCKYQRYMDGKRW